MTPERFDLGAHIDPWIDATSRNTDFWRAARRLARLDEATIRDAQTLAAPLSLVALVEDWCGDAVNALPVVARLAEHAPAVSLRLFGREANPDLMDSHLTRGTRSIPVVIAYDAAWVERGWWGPRPAELQRLVLEEWQGLEKADRSRRVREWYARDRGRSVAREVFALLRRATEDSPGTGGGE